MLTWLPGEISQNVAQRDMKIKHMKERLRHREDWRGNPTYIFIWVIEVE